MDPDERLRLFKRDGYTVFDQGLDQTWVQNMRQRHGELRARVAAAGGCDASMAITDLIELAPGPSLHAISLPPVLDFAESLIGPHVQLESITFTSFPSQPRGDGAVNGWHRDLFATYPEDGIYQRPLLFNAIVYLQDLDDVVGPLRVIPGSHRRAMGVAPDRMRLPHPEELRLYPKAGDVVLFHCALLHTGSPNTSPDPRYFFCITYNHCWLKHRGNYDGPMARRIIAHARAVGDRRLLRLLGSDAHLFDRANGGVNEPDEAMWPRWAEEDAAALRPG